MMKYYKPHDYQKYAIEKIKENKKFALFMDMGLGKTSVSLSAIDYLMNDKMEINKVLIFAPLRVAAFTWSEEIQNFADFNHLRLSKVIGTKAKRIKALNTAADIYIINRENTVWLKNYFVQEKRWPFQMIVIDESSSYKNSQSKRFKAMKLLVKAVPRVLLLTGTPTPRGLEDLWAQIYLLDEGERLGGTLTAYRDKYFIPGRRNRNVIYEYLPRAGASHEIQAQIRDIAVSMKAVDHLKMPERVDNIIKIELPPAARKKYQEMAYNYITTIDEKDITVGSAGAVQMKLLQMANGAVYDGTDEKTWIHIHDAKLDALEELIEIHEDRPIMVLYSFKHDLERLQKRFAKYEPRILRDEKDKRDWDAGKIRLLLAHPGSMGHGLNLQAGGSFIVWFGLTNNLEYYKQSNARLYRQGQKETVIINHLIVVDTADEDTLANLSRKDRDQEALLAGVKARIESIKKENEKQTLKK